MRTLTNSLIARPVQAGMLFTFIVAAFAIKPMAAEVVADSFSQEKIELTFDVAEDMDKYVEHRTAVGVEPVRGSQFVTEGKIYPAYTIPGNGAQFDPNMPGSRGTWFCKGVFLVKGSEFDKSPTAVVSDQVYLLPGDGNTITTAGTEGNGLAVRTVTGGTGSFAGYIGVQRQQFLGFNKSGGVNLRVTITLRKATK